ncbi:MAG TPA: S41 family peptidase [Terriglobales bacterium]|nr:S41 family peptidase [Terriglobales bacterium]
MIRRRLALVTLLAVLFALGWWVGRVSSRDLYGDLDLFVEVLHKVEANYVDPVEPQPLMRGAIKGLLRELDPYSQYLDSKAYANLMSVTQGSFGGIGVEVNVREGYPTVIAPIEGTPAWEAGLRSGDVITEIDGKSAYGLTVEDAADRLRGAPGSQVQLQISREGEEQPHEVTLTRRTIETKAVRTAFVTTDGVGYLRLAAFTQRAGDEIASALDQLRRQGARSLVLDLRMNPGGLLEQAVRVTGEFVPRTTMVVYTHGRARSEDNRFYADDTRPNLRWPLVVLVDGGSASASEIVAGALQDLDRALLVGTTTYGKGSVQRVFPLSESRTALKLTTALYYTPSGRSINRATPDTLADEEDDSAEETPAPVRDSLPRPLYHTRAGRPVLGGGGITPDVIVRADTLSGLLRVVESRNLAFRFANRWLNDHPVAEPDANVPVPWSGFLSWLRGEHVEFTSAQVDSQRVPLERAVRREMARRMFGDGAAARVALEGDPVWARARAVLEKARSPRDVFAVAAAGSGESPARPGGRR